MLFIKPEFRVYVVYASKPVLIEDVDFLVKGIVKNGSLETSYAERIGYSLYY